MPLREEEFLPRDTPTTKTINDIEYEFIGWHERVDTFNVGDRIGGDKYFITYSGPDPVYSDIWNLRWNWYPDTSHEEYHFAGKRTMTDMRWAPTVYIIQEEVELHDLRL